MGSQEEPYVTHRERCRRHEAAGAATCRLYRCSVGPTAFLWLKRGGVLGMAPAHSPQL